MVNLSWEGRTVDLFDADGLFTADGSSWDDLLKLFLEEFIPLINQVDSID